MVSPVANDAKFGVWPWLMVHLVENTPAGGMAFAGGGPPARIGGPLGSIALAAAAGPPPAGPSSNAFSISSLSERLSVDPLLRVPRP